VLDGGIQKEYRSVRLAKRQWAHCGVRFGEIGDDR
jgi:hypothetical protein